MEENKTRSSTMKEIKEEKQDINEINSYKNKNVLENLINLQQLIKKEAVLKKLCKLYQYIINFNIYIIQI